MEDKQDRFDDHLRLADFYMEVRRDRRQHEWKVSLGLWLALAAGAVSVTKLPQIPTVILALILLLVTIGHAYLWVRSNYIRNERDAIRAYTHTDKAETLLDVIFPPYKKPKREIWFLPQWIAITVDKWVPAWLQEGTTLFEISATGILSLAWVLVNCVNHHK